MQIKQDPVTGLWCRSDGAVLMPPCHNIHRFTYTWAFGSDNGHGYRQIQFHGKHYQVHRIICRAFHGLPPEDKPFVDHINRIKDDNRPSNLHWASIKENNNNKDCVDRSVEKYRVRSCDDKAAYHSAYHKVYDAEKRAQGLHYCKGPTGKWGWFPRNCS